MTVIAHVSDTHFGAIDPPVLQALLDELHSHAVDLILLTGDITQRARSAQFRAARTFIDALPRVPLLALPGNHDIPLYDLFTRFLRPYGRYRRYIGTELEPCWSDATLAVRCINATRPTRRKNGVLTPEKIECTARWLQGVSRPFRVVAVHQPLAVPLQSEERNLARGAPAALERWIAAGADLILGGHIHLPYCLEVRAAHCRRSAVLLQAGTSTSLRVRHGVPNSYNRITLEQRGTMRRMHLERRDYDTALQRFAMHVEYTAVSMADDWTLQLHDE